MEAEAQCPYCGEWLTLFVDPGGTSMQRYIEDCQVCCRPFEVLAEQVGEDEVKVRLQRLDA